MKPVRMKIRAFAAVSIAVAMAIAWAWRWNEAAALRAELEAARMEAAELDALRGENIRQRAGQVSPEQVALWRDDREAILRAEAEIARLNKTGSAVDANTVRPATGASAAAPRRAVHEAIVARYAELPERLNLTAARAKRLNDLLVKRAEAEWGVVQTAMRDQRDPNSLATRQEAARARTAVEWEIRQALGEAHYATFQEWEWTLSARRIVQRAKAMLTRTPTPMSTEQAAALVPIVARARDRSVVNESRPEAYQIRLDDETVRAAEAVLSREQVRALEIIRDTAPRF